MRGYAVICLIFTLISCAQESERSKAEHIATKYEKEKSALSALRTIDVKDAGKNWLVVYQPPEGASGGDIKVWVDKRTMKIAGSIAEQ